MLKTVDGLNRRLDTAGEKLLFWKTDWKKLYKAQLRDSCFLVDKLSQRVKVKHMRAVYLAFYSELRKQK